MQERRLQEAVAIAGRDGDVDPKRSGCHEGEPPRDDEANDEADDYEKQ